VIDKTYSLEQIARAHVLLKEGYKKGNLIVSLIKIKNEMV